MMHVLILILKILLLVLAGLIGLVLLALCLVLFLPVRYRVNASVHGAPRLDCRVWWLAGLLRGFVSYDGGLAYGFNAAWVKLVTSEPGTGEKPAKKKKQKKHKKPEKSVKADKTDKADKADKAEKAVKPGEQGDPATHYQSDEENKTENVQENAPAAVGNATDEGAGDGRASGKSPLQRLRDIFRKLAQRLRSAWELVRGVALKSGDAVNRVKEKLEAARNAVMDEENRKLAAFLWGQLVLLLHHMAPTRYDINVRFGADSPDVTGKVTGAAAVVWAFLSKGKGRRGKFEYEPVFTEKVLDADCCLRGRIRVWNVALIALRVYRNPRMRRLLGK